MCSEGIPFPSKRADLLSAMEDIEEMVNDPCIALPLSYLSKKPLINPSTFFRTPTPISTVAILHDTQFTFSVSFEEKDEVAPASVVQSMSKCLI